MEQKIIGALRSKTMIFAALLVIAGTVQTQIDVFRAFLTPEWQGLLTLGVGVVVALLRWVTTLPLDER